MRPAARLARVAVRFQSEVTLRFGQRMADATSILSLMMLCAYLGAPVEISAAGSDEDDAIAAVEQVFQETDNGPAN